MGNASVITGIVQESLVTSAFLNQARLGRKQRKEGEKLLNQANMMDTTYSTPSEIEDAYKRALRDAELEGSNSPLTALLMNQALSNESARMGNINRYATSGAQAMAMGEQVNQETSREKNNALIAGYQENRRIKERNQDRLENMSLSLGDYRDQEYQMNVYMPWLQKFTEAQQMIASGTQNEYQGLVNLGTAKSGGTSFDSIDWNTVDFSRKQDAGKGKGSDGYYGFG